MTYGDACNIMLAVTVTCIVTAILGFVISCFD